ncbi:fcgbp: putative protein [Crotalus adamanteus]|uniref:IgGFc-binding protein N-terminal domain-containing protein n=1 Tax=Crotalus adamanteus TaxID=8729 RepID=A0AAW1AY09_CROAD
MIFHYRSYQAPTQVDTHIKGPVNFKGEFNPQKQICHRSQGLPDNPIAKQDLSGTKTKLTKTVVVLSGPSCAKKFTSCDHVVEQLLPVPNWGTIFSVPSLSYQNNNVAYVAAFLQNVVIYQSGVKEKTHNFVAGGFVQTDLTCSDPLALYAKI